MNELLLVNDGFRDATAAVQSALDRCGEVHIPQGRYRITRTLRVHSGTTVLAHPNAVLFLDGCVPKRAGDYLLTNDARDAADRDITLCGGIWDGNNRGEHNTKGDIHNLSGYSGTVLNFFNVERLTLRGLTVANSVTYNVRMAQVSDFLIEDVSFVSDRPGFNQDGLHFNGNCRRGVVRRVRALSFGQTNDDLIALNADDEMRRVENVGMERGDIEDIVFEDLYAENCHTVIRLLSFDHAIRRIAIRNVTAGFRCYAVNMDAARYCATPLFDDRDWPQGVGCIEDVSIRDFTAWTDGEMPAVKLETNCRGFSMENFRFRGGSNALEAHNLAPSRLTVDGKAHKVHGKDELFVRKDFSSLRADPLG